MIRYRVELSRQYKRFASLPDYYHLLWFLMEGGMGSEGRSAAGCDTLPMFDLLEAQKRREGGRDGSIARFIFHSTTPPVRSKHNKLPSTSRLVFTN